ncbi:metal-chelation protein CHAD [Amycolatopsis antarctica]|uniref:Metal-chelation protein CHAD n=1 Tax=Amycolatopsis antarctica TaxID=1854586 RepID=A0A263D9F0_9PSEU|nr:CHAD domain-containing protein [Amycolatopsis antarctica]OZM75110.1 metal-chelation protein CHAD [Amycolatopsis antarctica]
MSTASSPPVPPVRPAPAARRVTPVPEDLGLPATPPVAAPEDPPTTHVRARIDALLRTILAHEPGTRAGTDPEELHQFRVATRRLRSVLKQSGAQLGPTAVTVRSELSWLGGALGEVRDHDVLIEALRATVADFEDEDQQAARALVAVFIAERGKAKRRLNRSLTGRRYDSLLQSIAQLARTPDIEPDAGTVAGREERAPLVDSVRKPYRKLGKAVAKLGPNPSDEQLHKVRIRGKRLRYAAELARSAARKKDAKRLKAVVRSAKSLQSVLGDHQDAVVAADRMRELSRTQGDAAIGFIAGRIAEREQVRRNRARAAWPSAAKRVDGAVKKLL